MFLLHSEASNGSSCRPLREHESKSYIFEHHVLNNFNFSVEQR